MPTLEDLERQVRRRAVGRTIAEICRDLAVVPGFCTPAFWNGLFEIMHYFGGSVATVMREKTRREQAFIQEQDKKLDSTWDWLHLKRDEIRQVLGFFIGEPPVDPFATPPRHWPPAHPDPSQNDVTLTHGTGQRPAPPSPACSHRRWRAHRLVVRAASEYSVSLDEHQLVFGRESTASTSFA